MYLDVGIGEEVLFEDEREGYEDTDAEEFAEGLVLGRGCDSFEHEFAAHYLNGSFTGLIWFHCVKMKSNEGKTTERPR